MRILVVADEECRYFWDYYQPGRLKEYDLMLSCGDLKSEYLSFLVTMGRAPLLYVHGNHDTNYDRKPPEGCMPIEDIVFKYGDLRILGLGGCRKYSGGPHQYTEKQMAKRIRKLRFKLWRSKGVDIVLTHSPVRDYGDDDDLPHRGFECFWGSESQIFLFRHSDVPFTDVRQMERDRYGLSLMATSNSMMFSYLPAGDEPFGDREYEYMYHTNLLNRRE